MKRLPRGGLADVTLVEPTSREGVYHDDTHNPTPTRPRPGCGFGDGRWLAAGLRFLQGGRGETLVTAGAAGADHRAALRIVALATRTGLDDHGCACGPWHA